VGGTVEGDGSLRLGALRELDHAGPTDLAVVFRSDFLVRAQTSAAACLLLGDGMVVEGADRTVIRVADPDRAVDVLVLALTPDPSVVTPGIHARALVDETADVDDTAQVEAHATVAAGARIGARSRLMAGAYVGPSARIGADVVLHPYVIVGDRCQVGDRVTIHGGSVLGADGFGYRQDDSGRHQKIPQRGIVRIGDDVEIGAHVTIDRARFDETSIGPNTKIDDQVHVGHNVTIGENCALAGKVALAGSVTIGSNVLLGGASRVADGVSIGDGAMIGGAALVTRDVSPRAAVNGQPARPVRQWRREQVVARKMPDLMERLKRLERRIEGS
jgi:UDP-3-O-[3-hydroxymyristoyl] glucosamine N-acyltransferase